MSDDFDGSSPRQQDASGDQQSGDASGSDPPGALTRDSTAGNQDRTPTYRADDGSVTEAGFIESIPWQAAIAVGIAIFLIGMLTQFALLSIDKELQEGEGSLFEESDDQISVVNVVAWWHYNAHFVDIQAETDEGAVSGNLFTATYPDEGEDHMKIPSYVYRLVPIVFLVAGGYLYTRRVSNGRRMGYSPAVIGATILSGYLIAAFLGAFIFREQITILFTEVSVSPTLSGSILWAGIVYPAMFGGLGGFLTDLDL